MTEPTAAHWVAGFWNFVREAGSYLAGLFTMIFMSIVWTLRRTFKDYPTTREMEIHVQKCRTDVMSRINDNHSTVMQKIDTSQQETASELVNIRRELGQGIGEMKNLIINHLDKK